MLFLKKTFKKDLNIPRGNFGGWFRKKSKMCGVLGFNYEDKSFLRDAMREIRHRGPDSSGKFLDKNVSKSIFNQNLIYFSRFSDVV